jgi:hypothetical protein
MATPAHGALSRPPQSPTTATLFFVFLNINGMKAVVLKREPGTNNAIRFQSGTYVLADWFAEHLHIERPVFDWTIVIDPAQADATS